MQAADLILAPRWIVPVEPAGQVLADHALVVRDGLIVAVLPRQQAVATFRATCLLERPDHVLMPGLVNAHTHAAMSLFRGLADDLPLEVWLREYIWPAETRWVAADFVRDGAELAMLEMVRGGTTCFSDMYFFPDIVGLAAIDHGLRTCIGMIVLEHPTIWATSADEYISKGLAVHDQFRGQPLIRTTFAPHAPYTVSDESFRQIRMLADELEAPITMHVAETATEVSESCRDHGRRPLRRLDDLGLVSPLLAAVHVTQIDDREIALLASRGATVVHCPESNLKLASGFCPVGRLLASGVNVALGTDGACSNNDLDMFGEMRTAALVAKAVAGDARTADAASVLTMATLGGARALGLADTIGSLVPGKQADLICVDLSAPATQPVHHPISQLVYAASRDQVSDVFVAGRQLLADGVPTMVDASAIVGRAAVWQQKLGSTHG